MIYISDQLFRHSWGGGGGGGGGRAPRLIGGWRKPRVIDGAGRWQVFRHVALPIAKPASPSP